MAHIKLTPGLPGIIALFDYSPHVAEAMLQLAQTLMRGQSPLSPMERELIAARVSQENNCKFCHLSHFYTFYAFVKENKEKYEEIAESPRMEHLLLIAAIVTKDIKVPDDVIDEARALGITDQELHDTVAITAAFNMFNRYVDGLNTPTPTEDKEYEEMGKRLATEGYLKHEEV